MYLSGGPRRALVDLCLAFAIGVALVFLNLAINFIDGIRLYFDTHFPFNLTSALLNMLFVWLAGLLLLAYLRWRKEAISRAEFEDVMSSISPDSLLVVSPDRRILVSNKSVVRMFGYSPSEIKGMRTERLYGDRREDPACEREIHDKVRREGFHVGQAIGLRRDGSTVPLEIITGELAERQGAVLVLRDISERVRAAERERAMTVKLQQKQKAESLGVLAGGIAHDFNNLLMVIQGNMDLALMSMKASDPARESLAEVRAATEKGTELCKEMLAYSGRGRFTVEPLDLSELVTGMRAVLDERVPDSIKIEYVLTPGLPRIDGDETQVRQSILNVVSNALDATGEESGAICLTTGVRECSLDELESLLFYDSQKPGPFVFLSVLDSGCGMGAETKAKAFEPFFSTKFTGRGLGLSSVQGIMRGHDGLVGVESETGHGTTLTLLFPVPEGAKSKPFQELETESEAGDPESMSSGTILAIDDEDEVLQVIKRMLTMLGYNVITAPGGQEGLAAFRAHGRDTVAVLLDLTMPVMNGAEVFREIRKIDDGIPVLMASGFDEKKAMAQITDRERVAHIQKPLEIDALQQALATLLRRS